MKILLAHYRVGETDGVSLEMDKWKSVLENQGHEAFYLAGSAGSVDANCIEALRYDNGLNAKITQDAFIEPTYFDNATQLVHAIEQQAKDIEKEAIKIIKDKQIDLIIPNNIFAVGHSLSAAIGLENAIQKTGVRVIHHHHDFHWEREKFASSVYPEIQEILDQYFPPKRVTDKHCVINQLAADSLKKKMNIESLVIPNVFDFENNHWVVDDYNHDFRAQFGIKESDIVFLQATRIVARKGIELAIDLIAQLQNEQQKEVTSWVGKVLYNKKMITSESQIVLLLVGMNEDNEYFLKLKNKAKKSNVKLLAINQCIKHSREVTNGKKHYSLWDAYVHADIVTYPSWLEGWGNQFLEGIVAKVPQVVYRYPVFESDIKPFGFNIIDLGCEFIWDEQGLATVTKRNIELAAKETQRYLFDGEFRRQSMDENFIIGKKNLSYSALGTLLATLVH
ncbi:glycosyltransferase family 4 protein [Vibrio sp. SS-MA-C1-2]|uniref:glycosyltransferase family 4 protein n=1 Tax=Vibrio sp. SS-MA-C1-2 TaxID=2908646 RepID=UPI001F3D7579|nr:glycosyltransferase family 4 protein [Vibrio sp. SS-MA-C1-2]UJF17804.1 glycosyltransferase family 4 protein [Vibrio sp. SS-MA-C1-2]